MTKPKPYKVPKTWQLPTDRAPTEHEEQRDFVRWMRQNHPTVRIFAIPNGGRRGKVEAARLKLEGVTKGVPDLFIPEWGIWIEMKTKTGRLSMEQKDWLSYLEGCGYHCIVPRGSLEAQAMVAQRRAQSLRGG